MAKWKDKNKVNKSVAQNIQDHIHWASKETYHFFRVTFNKKPLHQNDFIFRHRLGKFILVISTSQKTKVYFNQRGDTCKCDEIARGQFSKKSQKTACLSGWEFETDNSPVHALTYMYVTRHWNWMNSYWMVLNRPPPWSSLGEQFLWFLKNWPFVI